MKDIKTKPAQKRAALTRVRNIAKTAAVGVIKTAKDKAMQTADTAVSVQRQENQSASMQASGQMVSGGAHIAAGTAQKGVQATAAVYRFAKKHKNIKTAQSLTDIALLEDIVPPAATAPTPMKQHAGQLLNFQKANTKLSPHFEPQIATVKDKPQDTFRASQEIIKTRHNLPARFTSDAPTPNACTGAGKPAQTRSIKTRGQSVTKSMRHTVKQDVRGIKTAKHTAAKSKQAAKAAQNTVQQTARVAKVAVQRAAQAAKMVTKAFISAIKGFLAAMKSLVAAIAAIGGTAFSIILIIALVAVIAGSVLGIFMSVEPSGHGTPVSEMTSLLNEEYYKKISEIQAQVKHDKVEIVASDGVMGVKWEDVLAIYSCKLAASDDPMEVVTFDEQKKEVLRGILWDMNAIDYTTRVETKYINVPVLDEDGNKLYNENGEPLMDEESYTETTLVITVAHKTTDEMAVVYNFKPKQHEALALLKKSDYASLWAKLLGGLVNGSGEIITPDTDWTGTDIFSWPLPKSFRISSPYGYRKDPFTGKISFHGGTDIAAPFGTPILAAAGGTVTVANSTDPWGMSYGYHIKINHGSGQETLYAHCSSICVTAGQEVQAGEVIGFVGSTGNSNGNHLHFEVRINGNTTDVLDYFK